MASIVKNVKFLFFYSPGINPYTSKEYGKAFDAKYSLIFSGEKSCKCEECDKDFSCNSTLYTYLKIHTGEKAQKYKEYNKAYLYPSLLKEYQMICSGEKFYLCEKCGKVYSCLSFLKKHQRIH